MSIIYSIDVCIEVPVRDAEVTDRIGDAVEGIFPGVELDHEPGQLIGEAHELEHLSKHLHKRVIFDTARREFTKRCDNDGFSFALREQATFKSVINFSVGNPDELGNIEVHVTVRDPSVDEVTDYITPPTEGKRSADPNNR